MLLYLWFQYTYIRIHASLCSLRPYPQWSWQSVEMHQVTKRQHLKSCKSSYIYRCMWQHLTLQRLYFFRTNTHTARGGARAIECQSQKCNHSLTQFRRGATSTRCNCNIFTQWQRNKRTNARTTTLQITQWQLFNTVKLAVALALALTSLSFALYHVGSFW